MSYVPQFSPQPLGHVLVATPGTPVQITQTLQSTAAGSGNIVGSSTDAVPCKMISISASPITHSGTGNTGILYLGTKNMVRATLAGVIALIYPGQTLPVTVGDSVNPLDANTLYVDADTGSDGFFGSLYTL